MPHERTNHHRVAGERGVCPVETEDGTQHELTVQCDVALIWWPSGGLNAFTLSGDWIACPNVTTRDDVRALVRMLGGEWPDESSESN